MTFVPKRIVEVVAGLHDLAVREDIYCKDLSEKAVPTTMIFCKIEPLVAKTWEVSFSDIDFDVAKTCLT